MQYTALATDYDGTLAHDSHVPVEALAALQRLKNSGRKVILVTGREMPELESVFPEYSICDAIVAENGAQLWWPAEGREELLGEPVPTSFLDEVVRRGVKPFSVGKVVFATWRPHENVVLEVIQSLGIEYQIIFNKRAVMVLPSGVNKATGLTKVLKRLQISPHHVVGIGDAENDHAFLESCCVAVAVANALPALKERCDLVTEGDHAHGVIELVERLLSDDLQSLGPRRPRKETVVHKAKTPPAGPRPARVVDAAILRLREGSMEVLVIDIGGSSVKLWHTGHQEHRKFDSGKDLTPEVMVQRTLALVGDWTYEAVALGLPCRVSSGRPVEDPQNLGPGWVGGNLSAAFQQPARIMNDACLQALGSYDGGRMLFLGLGTAVGSALIADHLILSLDIGRLRFGEERVFELLGDKGYERLGPKKWQKAVHEIVPTLQHAVMADYVVVGGGNAKAIEELPDGFRRGNNRTVVEGGRRLWEELPDPAKQTPSEWLIL